jgi:hypothetical protein
MTQKSQAQRIRDAESPEDVFYENLILEVGDIVEGFILGYSKAMDQKFREGTYPILLIETPEGSRSVHVFHASMENGLVNCGAGVGDSVVIRRWDDKRNKADTQTYAYYQIAVDSKSPEPGQTFESFISGV